MGDTSVINSETLYRSERQSDQSPIDWLRATFPEVYHLGLNVYNGTRETISALADLSPSWFNLGKFIQLMISHQCILLVGKESLFLLGCLVFSYRLLKSEFTKSKNDHPNQTETGTEQTQLQSINTGLTGEHLQLLGLTSEELAPQTENTESKPASLALQLLFDYVWVVTVYLLPTGLVQLGLIFRSCDKGFAKFTESIKDSKVTLTVLWTTLGIDLYSKLYKPEGVLISFFNEAIDQLWPYAKDHLKTYMTSQLPRDLEARLGLISSRILQRPGNQYFPRVSAVTVNDTLFGKVVIDVNVRYNGNYVGFGLWPTGEKFQFSSFMIDAKLRLEFKSYPLPDESLIDRQIASRIGLIEKVKIKLKKINKFDIWSEGESGADELNPRKKPFMNAAEHIIKALFPLEFLTPLGEEDVQRPNTNRTPIQERLNVSPNAGGGRSSAPPPATTISTSMVAGGTSATSTQPLRVTSPTPRPSYTVGVPQVAPPPVNQRNRPMSVNAIVPGTSTTIGLPNTPQMTSHQSGHSTSASTSKSPHSEEVRSRSSMESDQLESTQEKTGNFIGSHTRNLHTAIQNQTGSASNEELSTLSTVTSTSSLRDTESSFGSIDLTIKFKAPRSLIITVHQLRDLPMRKGRTPQPYVKLVLQSAGGKDQKDSTQVLDKTKSPVFEKTYEFKLDLDLSEYTLKVTAKTKHKFHHALGHMTLGFVQSTNNTIEERRWYDLSQPKTTPQTTQIEYQKTTG